MLTKNKNDKRSGMIERARTYDAQKMVDTSTVVELVVIPL